MQQKPVDCHGDIHTIGERGDGGTTKDPQLALLNALRGGRWKQGVGAGTECYMLLETMR